MSAPDRQPRPVGPPPPGWTASPPPPYRPGTPGPGAPWRTAAGHDCAAARGARPTGVRRAERLDVGSSHARLQLVVAEPSRSRSSRSCSSSSVSASSSSCSCRTSASVRSSSSRSASLRPRPGSSAVSPSPPSPRSSSSAGAWRASARTSATSSATAGARSSSASGCSSPGRLARYQHARREWALVVGLVLGVIGLADVADTLPFDADLGGAHPAGPDRRGHVPHLSRDRLPARG